MAGMMAGVNEDNTPLGGMAMIKKVDGSYDELVKGLRAVTLEDMQEHFPNLEQFLTGTGKSANFIASDSTQTLIQFFERYNQKLSIFSALLNKNSLPLITKPTQDQVERWEGTYRIYRLSTLGDKIIVNLARLNSDGTVELKGYSKTNMFSGYWFLVHNHLTLFLDRKNGNTHYLFILAYQVGTSYRKEHRWFHGMSLSQTSHSNIRSGLEVLHYADDDFAEGRAMSIPLPHMGKHPEEYEALNRDFEGLATFLTGRKQNILHQDRLPQAFFKHEDDLKISFFHSACMFAHKAETADAKSKKQADLYERFKKEILLAIEHGFGQSEGDLANLLNERNNGYFKSLPLKYWDVVEQNVFGNRSGGDRATYTST